jgi:hypothetical protein
MKHVILCRWLASLLLCVSAASGSRAGVATTEITLTATGAAPMAFHAERIQDDQHVCQLLASKSGEQTLLLTFEAAVADMPLKPTAFGFSLSNGGRIGATWDETQPTAVLQVSVGRRVFLGLRGRDPAFRLQVTVSPSGDDGTFSATHLQDVANSQTIDVTGSWQCSPQRREKPADPLVATAAPPPPDARPVRSEGQRPEGQRAESQRADDQRQDVETVAAARVAPVSLASPNGSAATSPPTTSQSRGRRQFRIYQTDRCRGTDCATWTVTDVQTGKTLPAPVSVKGLKVRKSVLRQAHDADVELWITGIEKKDGAGNRIISVRHVDRVTPRYSASHACSGATATGCRQGA